MVYGVLYNIGGEKGLIYNMYTILQEEKNIEGVVKTTYGIKCEEMAVNDVSPNKKRGDRINRQTEQIRIVTLSSARCN